MPVEVLLADLADTDTAPVHHLAAAVLAAQPPELRRFLLRISVSERMWPDLVRQLTGVPDPGPPLAALHRAHAFVDADAGAPGGYRIPGLLRAVLEGQLAYEDPQLHTDLHRVRSDWFAAAGPLHDGVTPVVPEATAPCATRRPRHRRPAKSPRRTRPERT